MPQSCREKCDVDKNMMSRLRSVLPCRAEYSESLVVHCVGSVPCLRVAACTIAYCRCMDANKSVVLPVVKDLADEKISPTCLVF